VIIGETIFNYKFMILARAKPIGLKVPCLNTVRCSGLTLSVELIEYENSAYILEYEVV